MPASAPAERALGWEGVEMGVGFGWLVKVPMTVCEMAVARLSIVGVVRTVDTSIPDKEREVEIAVEVLVLEVLALGVNWQRVLPWVWLKLPGHWVNSGQHASETPGPS